MKAFVISQFGCCPLIKMFHSRVFNDKNDSYYRVLRTAYGDMSSLLQDLLKTIVKFQSIIGIYKFQQMECSKL